MPPANFLIRDPGSLIQHLRAQILADGLEQLGSS